MKAEANSDNSYSQPTNSSDIVNMIRLFNEELANHDALHVVRKKIIHGRTYILDDDKYYDLKSEISEAFKIHPNEVIIVGSAKLGFSIAPHKQYQQFSNSSDIDVAVISSHFFDNIWESIHRYNDSGGYHERLPDFRQYLFNGWIRPDLLPTSETFSFAKQWWEFFNDISQAGRYSSIKIRGGLYKNWYYLESYQIRGVSACKDLLKRKQK